jgi:hypothetical protein
MSTFIYTLQRKVQELQNTLRSLQEQNSNLRRRARMLSEAAPPGPPPGGTPEVGGAEEIMRTYGGLGYGAFVTRTTQDPRRGTGYYDNPLYSGFQFSNGFNNLIYPYSNYEDWMRLNGNNSTLVTIGNSTITVFYDMTPSTSIRGVAWWVIINMMNSPDFNPANFSSAGEFMSFLSSTVQGLIDIGRLSQSAGQSYLSRLSVPTVHQGNNNLYYYFSTVWNQIMTNGTWNTSTPPFWNS